MGKGRVQHPTGGEKLVQQHFKDETNINTIMQRHIAARPSTLQPPGRPGGREPIFTTLTGQSYHEMLCQVQEIQGKFNGLPSRIRKRFANNPQMLLKFLEDPKNLEEAIKLGLVQEEDLTPERKAQLDLVREAEAEDMRKFREWQSKQRANDNSPELIQDDDDDEVERESRPAKNAGRKPR